MSEIRVGIATDADRYRATDDTVWFNEALPYPSELMLTGLRPDQRFAAETDDADGTTYAGIYGVFPLELAVPGPGGDPRLVPSRMEEGQTKSYSILTIERLKAEGGELFFIVGADAFADIEKWYRAHDVIRAVEFIVVGRPGWRYAVPAGARVHRLDTLELPVSSSRIREQLARGEGVEELPKKVAGYIRENALYLRPQ